MRRNYQSALASLATVEAMAPHVGLEFTFGKLSPGEPGEVVAFFGLKFDNWTETYHGPADPEKMARHVRDTIERRDRILASTIAMQTQNN